MKNQEKAQKVAQQIVDAFQRGDVPKALAQIFIRRNIDSPTRHWSWRNQLLAMLEGHYDARGFRQWQQVGRSVKKGERAFYILGPCTRTAKKDNPEKGIKAGDKVLIGFRTIPVFGYSQTEGEPYPDAEEQTAFIEALPLLDVARAWNIEVDTFDGEKSGRLGYIQHEPRQIGLGVKNLSTWAHELVHAADYRLGTFKEASGQDPSNEVVAELGGAVILECLGYTDESDRGGCYQYVRHYAAESKEKPVSICTALLDRVCACVTLILDTADELPAAA